MTEPNERDIAIARTALSALDHLADSDNKHCSLCGGSGVATDEHISHDGVYKLTMIKCPRCGGEPDADKKVPEDARELVKREQKELFGDVLKECLECMTERRGYADMWEYKYGERWDKEDAIMKAAIMGGGRAMNEKLLIATEPDGSKWVLLESYKRLESEAKESIQSLANLMISRDERVKIEERKACAEKMERNMLDNYHQWANIRDAIESNRIVIMGGVEG